MNLQDAALIAAGVIGGGTALVHGILVQRLMVRPMEPVFATNQKLPPAIGRLVPLLLHFSTISWFLGGLFLIGAAIMADADTKVAAGLFVGSLFLFGALANLWGTRGRHPGWMLMAAAVGLIGFAIA